MAISNLLNTSLKPLSFGTQTTTTSGAPTSYTGLVGTPKTAINGVNAGVYTPQTGTVQPTSGGTTYTPPPVNTTAPQPTQTGTRGLFGDVATSLATRSTAGSPAATDYTAQAAAYGAGSIPIAAQARDIAQQFGQRYADIGQQGARFQAGQLSTGTSPVAEGNAAITARTTAAQQTALAEGEQAALQGIGYQLTGQQQAANAANAAAGQAYTGQGLVQSGLTSAAGLTKPSDNFPFVFDPATGSFTAPGVGGQGIGGGLTGNPQQDAQSIAQKVLNHQVSYADAVRALGYAGPTAEALLQSAVTNAGGNLQQLQSQSGIIDTQEQQLNTYEQAFQQAKLLQSQTSDLITQFGLNPNDLSRANQAIQAIAKETSGAQYKILENYLYDVANTYARILTPPGGSPTDYQSQIANSMINGLQSGSTIQQVMSALDVAAQGKIDKTRTILSNGAGTTSGGTTGGTVQTTAGAINTNW